MKRPDEALIGPLVLSEAACTPDVKVAAFAVRPPAALNPLATVIIPENIPLPAVRWPLRDAEPAVKAPPLDTLPTNTLLPPTLKSARAVTLFALTNDVMETAFAVSEPTVLSDDAATRLEAVTPLTVKSPATLIADADTRPVIRAAPVRAPEELTLALVTPPAVLTEPKRVAATNR